METQTPVKKQTSIKKNMIMNALLTVSSFLFPIITFPYVSRILHASGTGRINFVTSAVSYFAMFVQLGIPTYGVKMVAKYRDDKDKLSKLVHELLFINLFMAVIVYIVFFIAVFTVPKFYRNKELFLIIGITIGLNSLGIEWLYRGLEHYTYITIRSLIFKFIGIIAMFLLVKDESDYLIYGAIQIFATSASNVFNFIRSRKFINYKLYKDYNVMQHKNAVLTFFMMSVATTIYTNLDNVMLGLIKDDVDVGYYSAAVKIKHILLSVVTSISAVLLPRASYYVANGEIEEFHRILKKTMHFVLLLATPLSIYFMIYASEGITFLSGTGYEGAIIPMIIIMPTLFLIGITNVSGIQMLVPLGKEKKVLTSEIIGAIIDLILNMIFIPLIASTGAAIGTLVAEVGVLAYQMYVVKKEKVNLFEDIKPVQIIVSLLVSVALAVGFKFVDFVDAPVWNGFFRIVCSGILFFGAYYVCMLIFKNEIVLDNTKKLFGRFTKRK